MGYTPHLTAAVWLGRPEGNDAMPGNPSGGGLLARAWARFVGAALEDVPAEDLPEPEPIGTPDAATPSTQPGDTPGRPSPTPEPRITPGPDPGRPTDPDDGEPTPPPELEPEPEPPARAGASPTAPA